MIKKIEAENEIEIEYINNKKFDLTDRLEDFAAEIIHGRKSFKTEK